MTATLVRSQDMTIANNGVVEIEAPKPSVYVYIRPRKFMILTSC